MSEDSSSKFTKITFVVKTSNLPDYEAAARMMHQRGIIPEPDVRQIAFIGFKYLIQQWSKQEEELKARNARVQPLSVRERYLQNPGTVAPPARPPIGEVGQNW